MLDSPRKSPWTVGTVIAATIAGATVITIAALFLNMVGPAAARESRAACAGLKPEPMATALCPQNQPGCTLPQPAPDFTVETHDGKTVRLSDFRGKVVLLNFWASWCGVCKSEKPALEGMARELGSADDFVVLTLASDDDWAKVLLAMVIARSPSAVPVRFRRTSPAADIPTLAEALDLYAKVLPDGTPYQVYLDRPSDNSNIGNVAARWGTSAVPESFLIDRTGRVRYYFVNKREWRSSVAQTCLKSVIAE